MYKVLRTNALIKKGLRQPTHTDMCAGLLRTNALIKKGLRLDFHGYMFLLVGSKNQRPD